MQSFEKRAGLTDTGYTPHKGLAAEETKYRRMAQSMQVSQLSVAFLCDASSVVPL